jgi:hypothetical protein
MFESFGGRAAVLRCREERRFKIRLFVCGRSFLKAVSTGRAIMENTFHFKAGRHWY